MAVEDLDIVGTWPELTGKTLEQLIAQESWFEGELDDEANVIWLQAAGQWHRLYFDNDAVFWSTPPDAPRVRTPESGGTPEFPMNDLAAKYAISGQPITACDGDWADDTSTVSLRFENGTSLTFRNRFDTTTILMDQSER